MFAVLCRYLSIAFALSVLLWIGGCANTKPVAVDYDPQADLTHLETFYLLEPLADELVSPLEMKRANQAVDETLRRRYLVADSAASADFLVQVQLRVVERTTLQQDPMVVYGGYSRWNYWGFGAPLRSHKYRESTLIVDILSPSRSPLWRGSLVMKPGKRKPEEAYQLLREEAAQILNRFPPIKVPSLN